LLASPNRRDSEQPITKLQVSPNNRSFYIVLVDSPTVRINKKPKTVSSIERRQSPRPRNDTYIVLKVAKR
jgi:hypothetical protein